MYKIYVLHKLGQRRYYLDRHILRKPNFYVYNYSSFRIINSSYEQNFIFIVFPYTSITLVEPHLFIRWAQSFLFNILYFIYFGGIVWKSYYLVHLVSSYFIEAS